MSKQFYFAILILFVTFSGLSQSWVTYEGAVLPNDASISRPFVTSGGTFSATENTIVDDEAVSGNKLLKMDIAGDAISFQWRLRFDAHSTQTAIDLNSLTLVFRAKGNADRVMGLDVDIEFDGFRSRVIFFNGTNLADIQNGTGTDATLAVNVTDWNVYRFTMTTTETKIYINESTTPALTFTPATVTTTNNHFRFGDGSTTAGRTMGSNIDFVTYESTGAYSPSERALPSGLVPVQADAAYLSDLKVDGTTVAGFAGGTFQYTVALNAGTTTVPTVTATALNTAATLVVTPATSLPGSTTVAVTNGSSSQTYTINFTVPDAAHLSDLKVDGTTISGFTSGTFEYSMELPYGTTVVPTVTATTVHTSASAVVTAATSLPGSTTVAVTNGSASQTYTVNFTIAPNTDATLSGISVEGTTLANFDPATTSYEVPLPAETSTAPEVIATTTDANATYIVTNPDAIPGIASIEVTAEDGTTKMTYQLSYVLLPSTDATLSDLQVSEVTIEGFSSTDMEYDVVLDDFEVPAVVAVTSHDQAVAVVTLPGEIPGTATILVTAEDEETSVTYTINFTTTAVKLGGIEDSILEVFPNPVANRVVINHSREVALVRLFNGSGQLIQKFVNSENQDRIQLDATHLGSGMYFLNIELKSGEIIKTKLVK